MKPAQPISTPLTQRLRRARMGALPLLVWIVAVCMVAQLWLGAPRASTYVGLAIGPEMRVTCPDDARLERLLVGLYQPVGSGQVLATLDDSKLEARMDTARAVLEQLAAEMRAERVRLDSVRVSAELEAAARYQEAQSTASLEYPAELRAFFSDEALLELRALDARLERTLSELEKGRLEVALARAEAMLEGRIGARAEVEDLRLRIQLEERRTRNLASTEAEVQASMAGMRERRVALVRDYEAPLPARLADVDMDALLEGWEAGIATQRKRLAELALLRESYVLRAPVAGRVAALGASEGQFLLAGEEVLVLMGAEAREVALWVSEYSTDPPSVGDRLMVTDFVGQRSPRVAECVVRALSPRLELMPERLWRDARIAEYGRAGSVGPTGALALVPGQRVRIDPVP